MWRAIPAVRRLDAATRDRQACLVSPAGKASASAPLPSARRAWFPGDSAGVAENRRIPTLSRVQATLVRRLATSSDRPWIFLPRAAATRVSFPQPARPQQPRRPSTLPVCPGRAFVPRCRETDTATSQYQLPLTLLPVSRGTDAPCPHRRRGPRPAATERLADGRAAPILRRCPGQQCAVFPRRSLRRNFTKLPRLHRFNREKTFLDRVIRPIEQLVYRLTGIDEQREMRWTEYTVAMLLSSGVSMTLLYLIERTQKWLPFNPRGFPNVEPGLAFGTAASFTTNTNWQAYVPETTMSYLTQMAGLAYHNFVSAAVGIALAIAIVRGIARVEKDTLGNFWVDMVRATLWVLMPVCVLGALFLVWQGVPQNLKPYDVAQLLDPQTVEVTGADGKTSTQTVTQQVIAQGPVASQEVIKEFGTNGG